MMMMNSQQQQQQQSQQRQLVVVVEGTAALGPSWPLLLTEYVEKVLRSFCGFNVPGGQKHATTTGEMALVVYHSRGSQTGCILQQTGWTSNIDIFLRWLSSISFMGGGFGDGAVTEGLAEGLQMCCPGQNVPPATQGRDFQKHVILVAASNPCKVASPVPSPPVSNLMQSQSSNGDLQEQWSLADADVVATWFTTCSVSLSVVAPRQLQALRNVFAQAKRGGRAAESTPEPQRQYTQHLVLLSENFLEARLALLRTASGSNNTAPSSLTAKIENQPVVTASTGPAQMQPAGVRQPIGVASGMGVLPGRGSNLPMQPVTVKTEAVTSGTLSSLLQSNTNNNHALPMQPVPSSGSVASQDPMQAFSSLTSQDPSQDFKALGNIPASQPLRSVGGAIALPSLSNNNMMVHSPSQSRHTIGSPSLPPTSPLSGLQPSAVPVSTIMPTVNGGTSALSVTQGALGINAQTGGGSLIPSTVGLVGGQGVGVGAVHPSYSAGSTTLGGNTLIGATQQPSAVNIGGASAGQGTLPGLGGQNNLNPLNQMVQNGHGLSAQTLMGGGANGIGSPPMGSSVTGAMMPTTGVPQSPGQVQSHGGVSNTGVAAPLPSAPTTGTPPQQSAGNPPKYTRLWEGILAGQRKGNIVPIPICKLEGYRQTSSPDTLAADWPTTMQIMRLIPQEYMNHKDYQRKAELLVFRPLTTHDFLVQLADKKLCAVIQLPSQTLLLASTEKPGRMIGMLFPGDMVQIKPQVSSQQQAASGATAQPAASNNFSQNQLQGQLQNQLPNNQLPNQLPNQQPRSQMLQNSLQPGPASLHGTGFLP